MEPFSKLIRLNMRIMTLLIAAITLHSFSCFSQTLAKPKVEKSTTPAIIKTLKAERLTTPIKVDGALSEEVWKTITPAKDFIEYRPNPGAKEAYENRTEVYFLYDNTAIYVGGYCHERTADSVSKELVGRDRIGNSDFLGVIFDTYYDKINASGFYVTPYGEQFDAKYSNSGDNDEDESWNSVYESEAKVVSDGWTFEMKIPYSALRFSNRDNQTWGLNITRRRQKTSQQYFWNNVDPNINGFINQEGTWTGLKDIKSPVRLSFSPYFSTYINHYPYKTSGVKDFTSSVNGGLDVKYGITPAFTLDMTLVPDFGQVQSDNRVLNLTPFEVKYNEYRSFFTEGTELFNKGNLFYSRRVGGTPIHQAEVESLLDSSEHIRSNPTEAKLINATKISGRTAKGLGIGFFNAITKPMYATIENDHGGTRKVETNPLTNYNILVLDQTLKNNSSVSLINTNVLRDGVDPDANVTAGVFTFNNKKNTYGVNGKVAVSSISQQGASNTNGYSHFIGFSKTGKFNVFLSQELTDNKYNHNDLGILFNNNYLDHYLYLGYRWRKPTKWYNNINLNQNFNLSYRYKPYGFQTFNYNINANGQLKNLWFVGLFAGYNAPGTDFYEPRTNGRFFKTMEYYRYSAWVNTNENKKYSLYAELGYNDYKRFNGKSLALTLSNYYRFSDKFALGNMININPYTNNAGFADIDPLTNDIIFSRRNRNTVENTVNAKYNFNKKNGITFRARHYWSKVNIKEFFTLNDKGQLDKNTTFNGERNVNFNAFNIDMVYTWQFAPGSFINIVWKDAIYDDRQYIDQDYFKNFGNTIATSQNNNVSFKIIYYLDYLQLKKKR